MVLERSEARHRLAVNFERWQPVGDALLGVWRGEEDAPSELLERAAFILVEIHKVLVDITSWHGSSLPAPDSHYQSVAKGSTTDTALGPKRPIREGVPGLRRGVVVVWDAWWTTRPPN